jgi:DNA-directed RNA polymerase subunit RPC12/RpoP
VVIPEFFEEALKRQFGGRYLVRWSNARSCFVIDEKVSRGVAITPARLAAKLAKKPPAEAEEYLFRLRHGTTPYVEVFPGNQAACPRCDAKVLLRSREWIYAHCEACNKDFKAVHYDLGDLLLEALRYQDIYEHDAEDRILADMDRANDAKVKANDRESKETLKEAVWDDWRQIMSVPRSTQLERRI